MDLASGLFALAGVALAGGLAEFRSWREANKRSNDEFALLKRETYAKALRLTESVASRAARWLESPGPEAHAGFWEAITEAYQTLGEIRLITGEPRAAEKMNQTLRQYRDMVETGSTTFPKTTAEREALVRLFREDLGLN